MRRVRGRCGLVLATMVLSGACALGDDEPEAFEWRTEELDGGTIIEPPSSAAGGDDGGGGRTGGDWIINGLSDPTISGVSTAYALDSPQGLGAEGWLAENDPEGEKVIRYLVECALDEGDSVTVVAPTITYVFEGDVGLAPAWKTGPCNATCQHWVSACLLARTNETGADVEIFVQGDNPSLGFGYDPEYPNFEGTFFGNVFIDPAPMHACRGDSSGTAAAILQGRNCTLGEEHCGFTTYADCATHAGCDLGPTSLPTIDCQPIVGGPTYPGIAVHVRTP
jgi:hypothetical protein